MRQTLHFTITGNDKYKKIEIIPIFDTSGYKISINGVIRYGDMLFTKSEIDEKIQYWRKNMKMEEFFIDGSQSKIPDLKEVDEVVKKIKKKIKPIVVEDTQLKRGRGRPKGSKNKPKG